MKRTSKMFAIAIVVIMLISNVVNLFTNISLAITSNVTVEFSADSDDKIILKNDGKTLNYTCSDNSSYDFQLVQNGQAIELEQINDPVNGDKYVATGISSNENIKIYCPRINLGMVSIFYSGSPIGMYAQNVDVDYYSQFLVEIGDVNNYQFRIQENNNNPPIADISEAEFTVNFGNATWTIENKTTTASVAGKDITNGPVTIKGKQEIVLSNWQPDLMEAYIKVEDQEGREFITQLSVDENGVTKLMNTNSNIPQGEITFGVQRLPEHHDEGNNINMADEIYTVDFRPASWEVRGKTATASIEGLNITNSEVEIRGDKTIKLENFDSKLMEAVVRVLEPDKNIEECFSAKLNVNENGETCIANVRADFMPSDLPLMFEVQRRTNDGPENNLPPANTGSKVVVSGGEGYKTSYKDARIAINGFPVVLDDPQQNQNLGDEILESVTFDDFRYYYDNEEDKGTVDISFSALFLSKYVGQVKIVGKTLNGEVLEESYTTIVNVSDIINYENRTDWLEHYSGQQVGFDVEVAKADEYDIVVCLDEMEGYNIAIGNFLWSDEEGAVGNDGYIGNATLELEKVVYEIDLNNDNDYNDENEVVTVEGDDLFNHKYIEYSPYGSIGSLVVPEGALCTMKITPDYGYQVLTFGSNDNPIVTGNVSEFTFVAHKGNFHLSAQVIKVDDIVDAQSEKVKSGNIAIDNNEITTGTVVLTVDDMNPSEGKKQAFENEAGDYTISSYLNIDLNQVIYKGTAENVWSNELHELNEEATIQLELEENIDNNDIIVIHNIGDGDDYEIIEIEYYDSDTNTIEFKADSFSGYAIALKANQAVPENPDNPVNPDNPDNPVDPENPENPEEPATDKQKYSLTTGDFMVVFSDDVGHTFELNVIKLGNLTNEELEQLEITPEEYEQAKKELIEKFSKYGLLIDVYDITVSDENYSHFGEVTFKIKMTEEMKKFNKFKLICIDGDEVKDTDIVELKEEDGYLVGNLYHLSNYALFGEYVEPEKVNSVNTGDNIITFVTIFIIATLGMVITVKTKK